MPIPGATMAGLALSVIVGAGSFACLAFAVSTRIANPEAAAPAINITVLPLYFISGVFVPEAQIPRALRDLAAIFPIRPLAQALRGTFTEAHGAGIAAGHLLVIAAWGVAGLLVAARTFRWSPHSE